MLSVANIVSCAIEIWKRSSRNILMIAEVRSSNKGFGIQVTKVLASMFRFQDNNICTLFMLQKAIKYCIVGNRKYIMCVFIYGFILSLYCIYSCIEH